MSLLPLPLSLAAWKGTSLFHAFVHALVPLASPHLRDWSDSPISSLFAGLACSCGSFCISASFSHPSSHCGIQMMPHMVVAWWPSWPVLMSGYSHPSSLYVCLALPQWPVAWLAFSLLPAVLSTCPQTETSIQHLLSFSFFSFVVSCFISLNGDFFGLPSVPGTPLFTCVTAPSVSSSSVCLAFISCMYFHTFLVWPCAFLSAFCAIFLTLHLL